MSSISHSGSIRRAVPKGDEGMQKAIIYVKDARDMSDVEDCSIALVVTSPPYPMIAMWDEMFASLGANDWDRQHAVLDKVWDECARVLIDGGVMCINIGDATRKVDGRFRLFPNHVRVIAHCEELGLDTLPYILWKKPTNRPNAFLGSGFLPPNAYVTLDCEHILIFRKGGLRKFEPKDPTRIASTYTKRERDVWFSQIWDVRATRQDVKGMGRRSAAFPEEVPRRLIRMFSCEGDVVLDPFLGTGTTMKIALQSGRGCIGYELDAGLVPVLEKRLGKDLVMRAVNPAHR